MPELNECALCGATAPLVDGHLIPDFAVRRLRVDSPTPFFRGIDPNKRVQNVRDATTIDLVTPKLPSLVAFFIHSLTVNV
jgi:hypothetical protein